MVYCGQHVALISGLLLSVADMTVADCSLIDIVTTSPPAGVNQFLIDLIPSALLPPRSAVRPTRTDICGHIVPYDLLDFGDLLLLAGVEQ
jgi:hypothetical protein